MKSVASSLTLFLFVIATLYKLLNLLLKKLLSLAKEEAQAEGDCFPAEVMGVEMGMQTKITQETQKEGGSGGGSLDPLIPRRICVCNATQRANRPARNENDEWRKI